MNCRCLWVAVGACLALTTSAQAAGDGRQLRNLADLPRKERNPIPTEKVWPAEVGGAHVCLWKDDKVAALSFTIDDNTKPDHAWWVEQGEKYGFRFTWFVITGRLVKGENPGFSGTWQDFQALVDRGHDVQSHTVSHRSKTANLTLDDDYAPSIEHLNGNLTGTRCLTLAYPGGALPNDPKVAAKYFAGARGVSGHRNSPSPDYLNTCSIGGAANAFIEPGQRGDWATLVGVAEKHPKAPTNYRAWYCMHFHGVHWNEQWRSKVEPPLIKLFDYVKQNEDKFWVGLFREVILYGQERDTAKLAVTAVTGKEIKFTLTDRMYDDWYDFPLTIKIRVPDDWERVQATQDAKPVSSAVIEHEGRRYGLVQAVPDRGEVVLRPKEEK